MPTTTSFVDRLIERLDRLDPSSVQGYILRLVREKELLETVFQTVREGVIIVDDKLCIRYVNHAAVNLLGLPADCTDQPIERYLRELDWSQLKAGDADAWARVSRQEIEVFYPQHRYLLCRFLPYESGIRSKDIADDTAAELEADGTPQLLDAITTGDEPMITLTLDDVTEIRERAASTIESERLAAITMLAAGVAHEIGNPLNSLTIHLQLLDRQLAALSSDGADNAKELVDVSLQEVRRLDDIINQFLKAVRPSIFEPGAVALHELIAKTLAFMKHEIEDRGVLVQGEWPDEIPKIMGDDTQLQQALYNIIKNGIQAMESGGVLVIKLSTTDDFVVLSVADSGKGIDREQLGDIFDPYYTTKPDGTGLGLVIVERIMREHGAEFGIDSEVGRGTVITMRFPLPARRQRLLTAKPISTDNTKDE